jgi:hypothetical protein
MLPSPSWLPTKVAASLATDAATTARKLENTASIAAAGKSVAYEARRAAIAPYPGLASSRYLQNAFAIRICSGVRHSGSNSAGEHTKMLKAFAREVATFNRFKLYRKFMPRGASACVEVVRE